MAVHAQSRRIENSRKWARSEICQLGRDAWRGPWALLMHPSRTSQRPVGNYANRGTATTCPDRRRPLLPGGTHESPPAPWESAPCRAEQHSPADGSALGSLPQQTSRRRWRRRPHSRRVRAPRVVLFSMRKGRVPPTPWPGTTNSCPKRKRGSRGSALASALSTRSAQTPRSSSRISRCARCRPQRLPRTGEQR